MEPGLQEPPWHGVGIIICLGWRDLYLYLSQLHQSPWNVAFHDNCNDATTIAPEHHDVQSSDGSHQPKHGYLE